MHVSRLCGKSVTWDMLPSVMHKADRLPCLPLQVRTAPPHQPVEHLASFRAMPDILMFRPAGGNEVAGSYKVGTSVSAVNRLS